MATAPNEEWTVVVVCQQDASRGRMYRFPPTASVQEVLEKWSEDVGVEAEAFLARRADDSEVGRRADMLSVGETAPGAKIVTLKVEEADLVFVGFYGSSDAEMRRVGVRLSTPPHEVEPLIREALGLPSERQFRLRSGAGPLVLGVALSAQGVEPGSALVVDPAFEVQVHDPWSDARDRYLVYASDACSLLMNAGSRAGQRLLFDGREVESGREVLDALLPFGAPRRWHFSLRLDVLQEVMLCVSRRLRSAQVWPYSSVARLLRAMSAASAAVLFDGVMVRQASALCRLGLPEGSVLHARPVSVTVRSSEGRRLIAHVPDGATAADVKESIRRKEKETNFVLLRGSHELVDEDVVRDGDELQVRASSMTLRIRMDDAWYSWPTARRSVTFTDLMKVVSAVGHTPLDDLLEKTLCCSGCGRSVWKGEEAFQTIPAACCRERSMTLCEVAKRDAASQSASAARRDHRSVGEGCPEVRSRGVQAAWFWHQVGTMTEPSMTAACVGTDGGKASASVGTAPCVQDSPPLRVVVEGSARPLHVLFARPGDSLGSVLGLLRRRRLLMGVRAVRAPGAGVLSALPGWRERSLEACGVGPGGELVVEPFVPASARVSVFDPTSNMSVATVTAPVAGLGVDWDSLRAEVERQSGRALQSAVAVQAGSLYLRDGHRRRSVESYNVERKEFLPLDEDDGAEEDKSQRSHLLFDIAPRGIAAAPAQLPRLAVFARSSVRRVSEAGELLPADLDALFDRRAVLLLQGLLLTDGGGRRAAMMLWLLGGRFADVATGALHQDEQSAASSHRRPGAEWSRLWLVVRAGERLPRFPLPAGEIVHVFTRRGVAVAVAEEEGLVTAASDPADPDASEWTAEWRPSEFNLAVTRAMSLR